MPLNPRLLCNQTSPDLDNVRDLESHHLTINQTGFYYFIFSNENEIKDNFMSAKFRMRKTAFEVENSLMKCTNQTECNLPLTFWSHEQVVIEMPEYQPGRTCMENAQNGISYKEGCTSFVESTCVPRRSVYMTFVFMVPIVILFCAR